MRRSCSRNTHASGCLPVVTSLRAPWTLVRPSATTESPASTYCSTSLHPIERFSQAVEESFHTLGAPPSTLHVLLRHRLPRQSDGFKASPRRREPFDTKDLSVAKRDDSPIFELRSYAAPLAAHVSPHTRRDHVLSFRTRR